MLNLLNYFNNFIELYALNNFSDYQDAIIAPELSLSGAVLLYHSGISASLNNGLITVDVLLNITFKKFKYNKTKKKEEIRFMENLFRQLSFREHQLYCFINIPLFPFLYIIFNIKKSNIIHTKLFV